VKIAIFTQHYFPENFRINYIVDELKKNNEIFVFTSIPNYNLSEKIIKQYKKKYPYKITEPNLVIVRFPVFFQKKSYLSKIFNFVTYIISLCFYLNFIKKEKFDVIFVYATSPIFQCIPAIYYKFLNRIPLVIWVQDLWPDILYDLKVPFAKFFSFFLNPLINWIYHSADIILCQSKSFKKKIAISNANKTFVYENPSDVINNKISFKLHKFFFRVLFVGNLGDAQDLNTVVSVAKVLKKKNKNITINIIGHGRQFSFLQSSIKEFKLEKYLNLYGYISPSKLKKYYLTSNALLITLSKGHGLSKTIPSKFQTYLAYGRPLLICSNGEINKIVKNNHLGLVCSSGDVNTLYKNILSLKNMRNKAYRKICFNCFNFYKKNYFLSKKIKELEKILYNSTKKI
jgi:glycosyltransferase involved in cell wall biosynthesis